MVERLGLTSLAVEELSVCIDPSFPASVTLSGPTACIINVMRLEVIE